MSEYEPVLPVDISVRFPAMLSVCILARILDPPMALTYSATIFSGFKGVSAVKPAGRPTAKIARRNQTPRRSLISKRLHIHRLDSESRAGAWKMQQPTLSGRKLEAEQQLSMVVPVPDLSIWAFPTELLTDLLAVDLHR